MGLDWDSSFRGAAKTSSCAGGQTGSQLPVPPPIHSALVDSGLGELFFGFGMGIQISHPPPLAPSLLTFLDERIKWNNVWEVLIGTYD